MAERPPPGYPRRDKPLPHDFHYAFALACNDDLLNKMQTTFLRTSTIDVDPTTIEVNPRNSNFLEDTGPLICAGSRVQFITINTSMVLTADATAAAGNAINALNIFHYNIHGAFRDSWTPEDLISTQDIAELLHVTSAPSADEDVVPETVSGNLLADNHPLSSVTGTEVFGSYDLTTNAICENTTTDTDVLGELADARNHFTNGALMMSLMSPIQKTVLTNHRRSRQIFERKFVPRQCRAANPNMIFSRQFIVPAIGNTYQIIGKGDSVDSATVVGFNVNVRFNEWNEEFNQMR